MSNRIEIPIHLVWTTWQREPMLHAEIKQAILGCIHGDAEKMGCIVLAINAMRDHVHLAVMLPSTLSIARLAQQVKGSSSSLARTLLGTERFFRWQEGYGAFAFPYAQRQRVIDYVLNQERHHTTGKLWRNWEEPEIENNSLSRP